MAAVEIRRATAGDCEAVAELCALLWPDGSLQEHAAKLREKLASGMSGALPVAILVAANVENGALAGFVEVGLRSHAESCDTARPVGYAEGWFVREELRKSGVGASPPARPLRPLSLYQRASPAQRRPIAQTGGTFR